MENHYAERTLAIAGAGGPLGIAVPIDCNYIAITNLSNADVLRVITDQANATAHRDIEPGDERVIDAPRDASNVRFKAGQVYFYLACVDIAHTLNAALTFLI